jgi:prepilin-type N-terminal cleavage/methylation domain-containing protein
MKQFPVKKGIRSAFTLIELLVVIAIIAILAALRLPALTSANNRHYAVTDINNVKQTMLAMTMYCAENNDYLPQPGWGFNTPNWIEACTLTKPVPHMTVHTLVTLQRDYDCQVSWFTGISATETPTLIPPGHAQLYQYLINPKLFLCPQDVVNANYLKRSEIISSYCWNGAPVGYGAYGTNTYKLNKFKPTNVLEWENDDSNPNNFGDWSQRPVDYTISFSRRHGNAALVGRMDGSAGRDIFADIVAMATSSQANDLWCNPGTSKGH